LVKTIRIPQERLYSAAWSCAAARSKTSQAELHRLWWIAGQGRAVARLGKFKRYPMYYYPSIFFARRDDFTPRKS
jgi:hypothetical protein